jgi:hypothetical protein
MGRRIYGHVMRYGRGLVAVIGFAPIEQAFQRSKVMLAGRPAAIERRVGVLAQRVLDDRGRDVFQLAARPHCIELHLAGSLKEIEAVIGLGHCRADHQDTV